jgi:DNA-binding response OmpR family regulator
MPKPSLAIGSPPDILVVDCDRNRGLVRTCLEREGYRVRCYDGREACDASGRGPRSSSSTSCCQGRRPQVMRILRASDVPVLLLTARGSLPERIIRLEQRRRSC